MNFYEKNNFEQEELKSKKKMKIIAVVLLILLIFSAIILGYIYYLKNEQLKVYIDGKLVKTQSNTFIFDEEDVYVSIKDFAPLVGYAVNNGEYKRPYSEDTTKCYVDNGYETASYELDSEELYKVLTENKDDADVDYEYYTIDKPVVKANNKLYTTIEGITKGCNIAFSYTATNNTIKVYTISYLSKHYSSKIADAAFDDKTPYANKKALLYNMVIVQNASEKYGVNNINNETIIGEKYKSITFLESSQEFVVETDEGKVGIITTDAITKIEPEYDSIKLIDKAATLYMVSNNDKYGVINKNGRIVIHLDYETIGVDFTKFPADDIDNPYFIYDKCIPVQKSGKWGMLDRNGNTILPTIYDGLGCQKITSKNTLANTLLLIPEYEAVVACKDGLYGLFNSSGKELIPALVTDMYSIISSGEKMYYLTYLGETRDVIDYLQNVLGIRPVTESVQDTIVDTNATVTPEVDMNTNTNPNQSTNTETNTTVNNVAIEVVNEQTVNTSTNVVTGNTVQQNTNQGSGNVLVVEQGTTQSKENVLVVEQNTTSSSEDVLVVQQNRTQSPDDALISN